MTFKNPFNSAQTISTEANGTAKPQKISYRVAHAIPGRIRFYIPRLATDSEYADKLKVVMESDSRITDVRINPKATSIVINYQSDVISHEQMCSDLVNLIQAAPNAANPKQATARSILGAIFDALVNFIDSVRNVNKARKGVMDGQFKSNGWERLLSSARDMTKGLKSAVMFVLPKRSSPTDNLTRAVNSQSSDATNNGRQN